MEYYKIKIRGHYPEYGRIACDANGNNIPNAEILFRKMKDEKISDLPILDYFFLESFDEKQYWEWILCDVYTFTKLSNYIQGWYISDNFKLFLENFKIAPQYHFYETRLLYKRDKIKYWIFQFPINPLQNYNYEKSEYYLDDIRVTGLKTVKEYDQYDYRIWKETKKNIKWKNIVLIDNFDLVKTMQNDIVVSEKLKNAIEENGISGFEFSELDYEVVVE
jgi:hypothetical protein